MFSSWEKEDWKDFGLAVFVNRPIFEANNEAAMIVQGIALPARKYSSASFCLFLVLNEPCSAAANTNSSDTTTMTTSAALRLAMAPSPVKVDNNAQQYAHDSDSLTRQFAEKFERISHEPRRNYPELGQCSDAPGPHQRGEFGTGRRTV